MMIGVTGLGALNMRCSVFDLPLLRKSWSWAEIGLGGSKVREDTKKSTRTNPKDMLAKELYPFKSKVSWSRWDARMARSLATQDTLLLEEGRLRDLTFLAVENGEVTKDGELEVEQWR